MFRFTDHIIGQMTLGCNLNCAYCYEGSRIKENKEYISFANFKKAFDSCVYQRCVLGERDNHLDWHFHGGEPLLNEEILEECIKYINRRRKFFPNLTFCIQTNGTLVTEKVARLFVENDVSIGISFDGFESNGRMTREQNESLIAKLRKLKKETGVRFGCLSVLSKENEKTWFNDMRATSDLFNQCGVNLLCADSSNAHKIPTADDQWDYWVKPCLETWTSSNPLRERYVQLAIENFITYEVLSTVKDQVDKTGCFNRICAHGVNMIGIRPDLSVHNCDKYAEEGSFVGNRPSYSVDSRDFLGLQQTLRYAKYCEEMFALETAKGCDNCPWSFLCTGECQSYNISTKGKLSLDSTPCSMYEKTFDFLKLNWMKILALHTIEAQAEIKGIRPSYLREIQLYGYKPIIDLENNTFKLEKIV